jgi:hypothetical protein
MKSCPVCSGAIGDPGVAYGYAGKWCYCTQALPQKLSSFSDLEILLEFKDRQNMASEIKRLRDLNDQLKARFEKETGVYYINGRKFVPVEMFDQVVEVLEMVQDNTKMPHQHTDPQLRLYCLAERAEEVLKKVEIK